MKEVPVKIAIRMQQKLIEEEVLYQIDVVELIRDQFGEEFLYLNENGNDAISRSVLTQFKKLTSETAIWVRDGLYWRIREDFDEPGRSTS